MTNVNTKKFCDEWISAWNNHDLDTILSHYSEEFEMTSPVIIRLMGEVSGSLKGKDKVREYWAKALALHPDLHFECLGVFSGVNSVVIQYRGHRGLAAEVMYFDEAGKVCKAFAHYES